MILSVAQIAASVVVLTLAGSSGRNMLQSSRIVANHNNNNQNSKELPAALMDIIASTSNNHNNNKSDGTGNGRSNSLDSTTITTTAANASFGSTRQQRIVEYLQSLKRKELLEIFASSSVPSTDSKDIPDILQGEWNGILLENNGFVMTKVSSILTHQLFGMGRTWNGKAFYYPHPNDDSTASATSTAATSTTPPHRGINRFLKRQSTTTSTSCCELEHSFDVSIAPSKLIPKEQSIQLRYFNYQTLPISLWKTMVDEVRFIPIGGNDNNGNNDNNDVLIGFGSMAWSGGMLNSAPFCLWRVSPSTESIKKTQ